MTGSTPPAMISLVFASHNAHKAQEIQAIAGEFLQIRSLADLGYTEDIPEPHATLEANASEKSRVVFRHTGLDCFSEDSGLEVVALHGAPGVHSARFAGESKDFGQNVRKLLREMEGKSDRRARFRAVISLIWKGKESQFEGICEGRISGKAQGQAGFGYDPVFIPEGSESSFAQMSLEEKNRYSHRRMAIQKMIDYLVNLGRKY
jgi:XTP/dITP diphosphohydrolase